MDASYINTVDDLVSQFKSNTMLLGIDLLKIIVYLFFNWRHLANSTMKLQNQGPKDDYLIT